MPLTPGTRLGAYEITAQVGVGGMGEVYRATDRNLGRDVAIKVLPDAFAQDAERLARFEREARTLASLNHPNIATVYGIEVVDSVRALVMEFVDGETLDARIARGPIPTAETRSIAREMAGALEAAHEQGSIHRDLKPANIKVREDGTVKVLDFGLAKMISDGPPKGGHYIDGHSVGLQPDLTMSPTITTAAPFDSRSGRPEHSRGPMTQIGVILGTAAYMSPEQAKGREADKRSDMWAFGAVVYEMLTGRRAFHGEDMSETLATVIKSDPDWSALSADVPSATRSLLRTCLQKDPRKRSVDATTALFVLSQPDDAQGDAAIVADPARAVRQRALYALSGALLAIVLVAGTAWMLRPTPAAPGLVRFSFDLPSGQQFTNTGRPFITVSPDGTRIIYVANRRLYVRSLSEPVPREIQGTEDPEGVTTPTFSPDGNSVAFVSASERTLKRISVSGGLAVPVCPINGSLGVSWTADEIVFADQAGDVVYRVAAGGGKPQVIFKTAAGESSFAPQILPGGSAMLLTIRRTGDVDLNVNSTAEEHIVVVSLATGERRTLIERGGDARYLSTGHIVYAVGEALFGARFDLERLQIVGDAVPLLQRVRRAPITPAAQYAVSGNGTLVYVEGSALADQTLAVFDRQGGVAPLKVPNASYQLPRLSPDGKRLAVEIDDGRTTNIWIYDLSGVHAIRQLTLEGRNQFPAWTSDGDRVVFTSDRGGDVAIWMQRADGAGPAERVTTPEPGMAHAPLAWHPREPVLLVNKYVSSRTRGASSLWTYAPSEKKLSPVAGVESQQPINASFSTDGRWIAYHTFGENNRSTLFVRPFPATESSYQVGSGGHPVWSGNGMELFFSRASTLFVTNVTTSPSFERGLTSEVPISFTASFWRNYDISPDGKRAIAVVPAQSSMTSGSMSPRIEIVLNWFEELKQSLPQ